VKGCWQILIFVLRFSLVSRIKGHCFFRQNKSVINSFLLRLINYTEHWPVFDNYIEQHVQTITELLCSATHYSNMYSWWTLLLTTDTSDQHYQLVRLFISIVVYHLY